MNCNSQQLSALEAFASSFACATISSLSTTQPARSLLRHTSMIGTVMMTSRMLHSSSRTIGRRFMTSGALDATKTSSTIPHPSAPPPITTPKPRTRLRPRKAAMSLTPSALAQLRQLLSQPDPKLIRVGVKNRGCSGLAYNLEYVEKPGSFDETVEQDGVKVLIDSKALFSIIGSEMDWVEDKLNRRFVFRNPNISEFQRHLPAKQSLTYLQRNNVDAASHSWYREFSWVEPLYIGQRALRTWRFGMANLALLLVLAWIHSDIPIRSRQESILLKTHRE